ncbi:MAG: hypothetical protein ACRDT0_16480, partial [Pseudonocardiaceae bacterium]
RSGWSGQVRPWGHEFRISSGSVPPVPTLARSPANAEPATSGDSVPAESTETLAPTSRTLAPEDEALAQLETLRQWDVASVRFDGQWVAQLASKKVGTVDLLQVASNGSHTFYAQDILAEHLDHRHGDNLGADVILLLTTDYGTTYQEEPLWVTFALGPFGSSDDVRAWCSSRFPELSGDVLTNACVPRQLEPPR